MYMIPSEKSEKSLSVPTIYTYKRYYILTIRIRGKEITTFSIAYCSAICFDVSDLFNVNPITDTVGIADFCINFKIEDKQSTPDFATLSHLSRTSAILNSKLSPRCNRIYKIVIHNNKYLLLFLKYFCINNFLLFPVYPNFSEFYNQIILLWLFYI